MVTVRMKTNSGSWQEYDLPIREEELLRWRKAFKKKQKAMSAKDELPKEAYPWNVEESSLHQLQTQPSGAKSAYRP